MVQSIPSKLLMETDNIFKTISLQQIHSILFLASGQIFFSGVVGLLADSSSSVWVSE